MSEEALRPPQPAEVVVELEALARGVLSVGAEAFGRVVATGELAADWLHKIVVLPRLLPCGECDACRRGALLRCPGAIGPEGAVSHRTVPARFLLSPLGAAERPPPSLLFLVDALSTPYAGLVRAGLQAGDPLVVLGNNPRAAATRLLGEYLGARLVDVAESAPLPARRIVATTRVEASQAISVAQPGDWLVLLDDGAQPTEAPTLPEVDLTIVRQGPAHPDLLPELDALVAGGALRLDGLDQQLPLEAMLGTSAAPVLRWATLPTQPR